MVLFGRLALVEEVCPQGQTCTIPGVLCVLFAVQGVSFPLATQPPRLPRPCGDSRPSLWNHAIKETFLSVSCLGCGIHPNQGKVRNTLSNMNFQPHHSFMGSLSHVSPAMGCNTCVMTVHAKHTCLKKLKGSRSGKHCLEHIKRAWEG